jgi:crooked neck
MLGFYVGARKVLMRWLAIKPQEHAYVIAARFEERIGEIDQARDVMHQMIQVYPQVSSFIKVAKFEERLRSRSRARQIYESAVAELGAAANNEAFFLEFTKFELRCHEVERARILFKYALAHLNKTDAPRLHQAYVDFEKQHGTSDNIEFVILNKRRHVYERQLLDNPMNYDVWFDYLKLEEDAGDTEAARKLYSRALEQKPPSLEKRHWRRYIYLWLFWAIFEEVHAQRPEAARQVYEDALAAVPHKSFSFSKLWTQYAQFEIRQLNLDKARKVFGVGLGKLGSPKLYESYIEMEMQLGEIERCRTLYEKYIQRHPNYPSAWAKFAEFERSLEETERSRAIMELAVEQQVDMPEVLWKAYIDLEIEAGDHDQVRDLFRRLLDKTTHVKVWLTAAQFEASVEDLDKARDLLREGEKHFKQTGDKESRLLLLEAWLELELQHGDDESCASVRSRLPRKLKMRRQLRQFGDEEPAQEEYLEYVFPEDEEEGKALKILEFAHRWKQGASQ